MDSDDYVVPGAIAAILPHLTDPDRPVICQMLRNGKPKPADLYIDRRIIARGWIGMPCIFLHSKHKNIFDFIATEDADYRFIKAVSDKLHCKFIKQVVVDAGLRGLGK